MFYSEIGHNRTFGVEKTFGKLLGKLQKNTEKSLLKQLTPILCCAMINKLSRSGRVFLMKPFCNRQAAEAAERNIDNCINQLKFRVKQILIEC